jgi:hypothetical protein
LSLHTPTLPSGNEFAMNLRGILRGKTERLTDA